MHRAGLLHHDVNVQNVMRDDDGRTVLMGFGTGRRIDQQVDMIAGTPLYLAPEIFRERPGLYAVLNGTQGQ